MFRNRCVCFSESYFSETLFKPFVFSSDEVIEAIFVWKQSSRQGTADHGLSAAVRLPAGVPKTSDGEKNGDWNHQQIEMDAEAISTVKLRIPSSSLGTHQR